MYIAMRSFGRTDFTSTRSLSVVRFIIVAFRFANVAFFAFFAERKATLVIFAMLRKCSIYGMVVFDDE